MLEAGISDVRIGIIPPGLDQVTFGDIRRTRLEDVKVLFFVGMNDGLVPLMENGGGLLTEIERGKLAIHHIHLAPSVRENTCTEQFYLYMNMTKPSEQLILTWSEQDASGKEKRPSSILNRIKNVFPQMKLQRVRMNEEQNTDFWHNYQFLIRGLREISETDRFRKTGRRFMTGFTAIRSIRRRPGSWWRLLSIIIRGILYPRRL